MKKNTTLPSQTSPGLTRDLGLLSIVMLGLGAIIGIVAGGWLSVILFRVSQAAWIVVCLWLVAGLVIYLARHHRNLSPNT